MKYYNKNLAFSNLPHYFSLLIITSFFSFFQVNAATAQTSIQSNETPSQELDWNVPTTELTEEEKKLAEQTALGWAKWDAENPNEASTVIYESEEAKESNKVKSPNEVLKDALIGSWEGFYGGNKAYIIFNENKTVVINTSVFSNVPSASGREHTQLYYEIDASKSPYRLIFYNRDKEIKGVFRIQNNNQIILCHNFKNEEQPQEIDNKYTVFTLYKLENKEDKKTD